MSDFLDNLKKAADTGEFNSDAAKKILEINELADSKIKGGNPEELNRLKESLEKRYEGQTKSVTEDEAIEMNSQYEKKMEQLKRMDFINAQLATLMEIEDMVKASVGDMFAFIIELRGKFKTEMDAEDPIIKDLAEKIKEIKSKYNSFIN